MSAPEIKPLGDTIKVVVVLAFTDNNCKLANEIASWAEVELKGAETYAMVKVCRESQAVFKNISQFHSNPPRKKGREK